MASKRLLEPVRGLFNAVNACSRSRHAPLVSSRGMATATILTTDTASPSQVVQDTYAQAHLTSTATEPILADTFSQASSAPSLNLYTPPPNPFLTTATTTLHAFPSFEPVSFASYPSTHLLLPLRRDILHRAIVFEGDATRQGTASTKWRSEVHGSNRKVRPQKGTGKARLGNKKSPMLSGGGVAFGPKPRDFSTDLPRKLYDLAWRTAMSYRYRRGELVVLADEAELDRNGPGSARWMRELLKWNQLGSKDGRSLFVTDSPRHNLTEALQEPYMGREARVLQLSDVDVKDLLETSKVVIEKAALDKLFFQHVSDLASKVKLAV